MIRVPGFWTTCLLVCMSTIICSQAGDRGKTLQAQVKSVAGTCQYGVDVTTNGYLCVRTIYNGAAAIEVRNLENGDLVEVVPLPKWTFLQTMWDGVVMMTRRGTLWRYRVGSGQVESEPLPGATRVVTRGDVLCWVLEGEHEHEAVACRDENGRIGRMPETMLEPGEKFFTMHLAVSEDGRFVVVAILQREAEEGEEEGKVGEDERDVYAVWDRQSGREWRVATEARGELAAVFSRGVAVSIERRFRDCKGKLQNPGRVRLWNVETGDVLKTIEVPVWMWSFVDGRLFLMELPDDHASGDIEMKVRELVIK